MTKAAVLVAMIAVASGLIQGITGMGGGMLLMLVLPLFFTVQVSSAVAGAICLFLTAAMVIRYRKKQSLICGRSSIRWTRQGRENTAATG